MKAYYKCEACGKYFEDSAGETEITADIDTWKIVDSLGHTYTRPIVSDATLKSEATCTKAAVYYYTCVRCDEHATDDAHTFIVGDPLGHRLTTVEAVAATCIADGNNRYYHCERCDVYFSDENAQNVTTPEAQVIPVDTNAHDWGEWTVTTPATCSAEGVETRVCNLDGTHTEERAVPIDPDAHKPVIVDGREPTCTEIGYTGATVCEYCNTPLAANGQIPALGHNWSAWTVTTEPTCTSAGEQKRTCERCGETETETIEALGHIEKDIPYLAPTCEAAGHEGGTYCERCGETLTPADVLMRLGHRYGEWIPITVGENAVDAENHQRICANDPNHVEYAAHSWDKGVATVTPTCHSEGTKLYTCKICGATKTETIPANTDAHVWGAWTANEGSRTHSRTCTNAGCTEKQTENCVFHSAVTANPTSFAANGEKTYFCNSCTGRYTEAFAATGMALSKTSVTVEAGKSADAVKALVQPGNAEAAAGEVTWASKDASVATVDANGVITGVSAGVAVITATATNANGESFMKSVTVTVTAGSQSIANLYVTAGGMSTMQMVGNTIQLQAKTPDGADAQNVEWTSTNSDVASVTKDGGQVTYNAVGTATIIAKTKDGKAKGSIVVTGTRDNTQVHNEDQTFTVIYTVGDCGYVINGQTINSDLMVTYVAGSKVTFRLTRNYYVLINGERQPRSADGTYTIESIDRNFSIVTTANENAGLTPDDGSNGSGSNGGNGGNNGSGSSTGSGPCNYCGQYHTGFFGALVGFFHGIFYFFKTMFGR